MFDEEPGHLLLDIPYPDSGSPAEGVRLNKSPASEQQMGEDGLPIAGAGTPKGLGDAPRPWNVSTMVRQLFLVIRAQPLCPLKGNRLWDDQDLVSDGFHCDERWSVDPHLLGQFSGSRRPAHKALGMGSVGCP